MLIDEDHLARQTAGDFALQAELLGLLLGQLEALRSMLDDGAGSAPPRPADLAAVLHRIRGAAAAVGADVLARAVAQAERDPDAHPGRPAGRDALRAALDAACAALPGLIAARSRAGLAKDGESR